mgnify:FL=1
MEISFKIDGKMQTFTKETIYLRDNIRAVKHQIVQSNYFESPQQSHEEYEKMQYDFCEMIAYIFDGEFSAEQLRDNYPLSEREKLDEIYILALGGTLKKESDDEKK